MKKLNIRVLQNELELLAQKINLAKNNIKINNLTQKMVTELLEAEFCSLWFYDHKNMLLLRERDDTTSRILSLEEKRGIIYKCFMTKEAKIYNSLVSEKDYIDEIDNPDGIKIYSKIIYPLFDNEDLIGIVTVYNSIKKAKKFRQDDMEALEILSPYLIDIFYKMHSRSDKKSTCHKLDFWKSQSFIVDRMQKLERRSQGRRASDNVVSEKMLGSMNNFIHDIRTPANTLQGFLELLEEQIKDKRLKEYLTNAKESAAFIGELTTAMLDQISLKREDEIVKIKEIETFSFFCEIAEMFISNMYAKKIAFNVYIDPLLPKRIKLDSLKLKRILINLLGNAYKFTPYQHSIELNVNYHAEIQSVTICVKDSGIGIAKEKQSEIFEAFKQAEATTSVEYGGTGLGLSICATYVENMGGKLELTSELEKGSSFYFTIPLDIKDETASLKPLKSEDIKITLLTEVKKASSILNLTKYLTDMGVNKSCIEELESFENITQDTTHLIIYQNQFEKYRSILSNRFEKVIIVEEKLFSISTDMCEGACEVIFEYGCYARELSNFVTPLKMPRVLIADDDNMSIFLLEKILENEYCDISVAYNGKEALEMILDSYKKEMPYSLVYMDNKMPYMNGSEVMQRVRIFEQENNFIPIYAVSTSGEEIKFPKNGFDAYVGKPFRMHEIRNLLKKRV